MKSLNQAQSIVEVSDKKFNENQATILIHIAKNKFITAEEIRSAMEEMSGPAVNSNLGVLVKADIVMKSGDGYITTEEGTELLEKASLIYNEANDVVVNKKLTDEINEQEKMVLDALAEKNIGVRYSRVNRSNYEILLQRRTQGIRQIEIRHKGFFRFWAYKVPTDLLIKFLEAGADYRETGVGNYYIDFDLSNENIELGLSVFFDYIEETEKNDRAEQIRKLREQQAK